MASYHKNKNNRYFVRFRWVNNSGKEINKKLSSFKTKREAEDAYIEFIANNPNNKKLADNIRELTLHDVYLKYLEHQKTKVKISTLYDTEKIYNKHIKDSFSNKKIINIKKIDVLNWQMVKNDEGFSYKYKTKMRWILGSIFKFAEQYYDLDNPVSKTQPFHEEKKPKKISIWTKENFDLFNKNIDNLMYKTFFKLLYYTGARLGEILALNLSDIDFKNKTLSINKNLTNKTYNKVYEIITPKNITSYREVELPDILINILQNYINDYKIKSSDLFLFGKEKPLADQTIRRLLYTKTSELNLPKIKLHDFRHSHASLLLNAGADITLIAKRLGHKNIEITLNTYSHLMPNHETEIVQKLNSLFEN